MSISASNSNNLTFIEVCSGAGGLSTGFINTGFTPILLNDNNKQCIETLKLNHNNYKIIHDNMEKIDFTDKSYENVDVFMGGVPCQSFSLAGKREGIDDDRGKLILTFIKNIDIIKPKVFLIENVKGLLNHDKGKTFNYILEKIAELNTKYTTYYKVLNANDYSVPQKRERLFLIGVSKSINKTFTFPNPHQYKPVLKDVLTNCPKSSGLTYPQNKCDLFKKIPQGGCWINLPIDEQKNYLGNSYNSGGGKRGILKRLDMNQPCLTLLTTPSQKQTERCHPIETRPLQTLEYARIQTFPDSYKFSGSTNQIYKQIGNAVPPKLAEAVALEIIKVLN